MGGHGSSGSPPAPKPPPPPSADPGLVRAQTIAQQSAMAPKTTAQSPFVSSPGVLTDYSNTILGA